MVNARFWGVSGVYTPLTPQNLGTSPPIPKERFFFEPGMIKPGFRSGGIVLSLGIFHWGGCREPVGWTANDGTMFRKSFAEVHPTCSFNHPTTPNTAASLPVNPVCGGNSTRISGTPRFGENGFQRRIDQIVSRSAHRSIPGSWNKASRRGDRQGRV